MSKRFFDSSPRQTPGADAGTAATPAPEPGDWAQRLQAARGDDAALLALTREASPLEVKLAAVAALASEAALKAAERELREHDRRAHQLAKQRYTHTVAQREARARAAGLIDEARALALEALIPLNRLVDIDRAWTALDAQLLDAGERSEYAALMAQMADTTRERADQPARLKRWTGQAREALASLHAACAAVASGTQERGQLADAGAAAQAVIDAAPQEAAGSTLPGELTRNLGLCSALDERVAVLEGEATDLGERWTQFEPLPDAALEALLQARFARWQLARQQLRDQRRAEQRGQDKQRRQSLREQHGQALAAALELAEAALAGGQLAPTHGHLVEIDKLLAGGAPVGALGARIDALQAQYAQLKGWQHWAGGRARDELVQQAEALAAASASGPAVAQAIKLSTKQQAEVIDDMRARWKELDHLGGATSRSLWQRFEAALKAAYEPVARQVAVQRAAREQNLQAREALLAELEVAPAPSVDEGAPQPDWRGLAEFLDRFGLAWRKLGPIEHTVPHKARAALLERMNVAVQRLEAPLQEARRVARLQRERLLERARALASEAPGRELVDKVRDLQAQWQQQARALPLARADENALWRDFKAAIDGAFSAREAAFQAREAEFSAHAAERAALIARLEALRADTPAAELKRALSEVEAAWQRAGPAPRSQAQALESQFRQAHDKARRWLAESAGRVWHVTCDALQAKLALCDDLEASADRAAAQTELAQRWSVLPALPPALEQVLALRAGLTGANAQGGPPSLAQSTDELLLQLEAAWGLESPAAIESARRLLKLQAMKAALESRRPAAPSPSPAQWLAELLRRTALDAAQRERLDAVLAALRRRGSLA
jgi:exonuclease SbcC